MSGCEYPPDSGRLAREQQICFGAVEGHNIRCVMARVIYWNREVVGRWAAHLIGFWLYGTGAAVFLYARGAPNVWTDYVSGWVCIAVFVAACVLGSLCLAALKALFIIVRSFRDPRRLPAADDRAIENSFWLHVPPEGKHNRLDT
jgi:hypothetical protein